MHYMYSDILGKYSVSDNFSHYLYNLGETAPPIQQGYWEELMDKKRVYKELSVHTWRAVCTLSPPPLHPCQWMGGETSQKGLPVRARPSSTHFLLIRSNISRRKFFSPEDHTSSSFVMALLCSWPFCAHGRQK